MKTWLRGARALGMSLIACLSNVDLARADSSLSIAHVQADQIRVDGELGEWRNARFTKLGSTSDGSARFSLAFAGGALLVAARVSDDAMVRSSSPSRKEDALVLTLVAPVAKGAPRVSELWLFAGVPGKQRSSAAIAAPGEALRAVQGATIIEGPPSSEQGQGYVLEARIPLEAIEGGELLLLGRGALALHDVDPGSARGETIASASGAPAKLPELLFDGGPNAALAAFVREKGLPPGDLRFERFGDVAGDDQLERVLVAGSYLLMASADRSGGFRFIDLPIAVGAALTEVALEDLTEDGKLEIVVSVREPEADAKLVYRSDGGRFVLHSQDRTPNAKALAAQARAADAAAGKPVDEVPAAEHSVVYDKPPEMDELVAAFRETRGVPASTRARFVTHANVAEDAAIESLMLFDRELLVVGKGFRGGTGFFYFGVPAASGADVLRMFTGDVTGDGRREIFIRIKQFVGEVQREILLGYTFEGDALQPILAQEVRRAQGGDSVGNIVSLERVGKRGRGFALHIEPGVAHGYTRESYPFVTEATDAYGALLLPWLHQEVVYRWDGSQLAH